ncbi:hypothetical protein KTGMC3_P1988 [Methanocalculus sp. MC3]
MKSKAKPKKQGIEERKRKQITLTIDPDHYTFIKNAGFKASRFFDSAISALKTNVQYAPILITTNKVQIMDESRKEDGPAEIRTQDLRHVKATS